jgi:hypothetical protein
LPGLIGLEIVRATAPSVESRCMVRSDHRGAERPTEMVLWPKARKRWYLPIPLGL